VINTHFKHRVVFKSQHGCRFNRLLQRESKKIMMEETKTVRLLTACAVAVLISSCSVQPPSTASTVSLEALFTVQGEGGRSVVRAITRADRCPTITWDEKRREPMTMRVAPATMPERGGGTQPDQKAAVFEILTCETTWPVDASSARVGDRIVPTPQRDIQRIVLIGDTGCRMKASENAFQDCNSNTLWPFAEIARKAAALNPDLVIHVGDIHYRESPCPADRTGCTNSAWGYGFDAWQADFFAPAAPLLAKAPWVFVRGNHESCFRAGQGWFRFVDPAAWTPERACDLPALDMTADFSVPYAVPIGKREQLIVFDSSKSSGKAYTPSDPAYQNYAKQMQRVTALANAVDASFFLSHHPILAFAPSDDGTSVKAGGSGGLQSAFRSVHPERLVPTNVNVLLHGHIHQFEAISFASEHPVSLIVGNSGSATEGRLPESIALGTTLSPGIVIDNYAAHSDYGFATLDRVAHDGAGGATRWRLTEFDVTGRALISCEISAGKSRCRKLL
jgi:hypothetical protein